MQFKSVNLVLGCILAIISSSAALPTSNGGLDTRSPVSAPLPSEDLASFSIDERGNVPDYTDLTRDIVAREPHPSTLTSRQTNLNAAADNLLFSVSLTSFLAAKRAGNPAGLDWSDNGCSSSPDKPFGFNFLDSCKRHDFGYRNYKAQGRFTEANRKKIDDLFLKDLLNECEQSHDGISEGVCTSTAHTYYMAVRAFGNL